MAQGTSFKIIRFAEINTDFITSQRKRNGQSDISHNNLNKDNFCQLFVFKFEKFS